MTTERNPVLMIHAMAWQLFLYSYAIMSAMASQITRVWIVWSTVCSGADQRKHQNSLSCAFVRGEQWLPLTKCQWCVQFSIWWCHPVGWKIQVKTYIKLFLSIPKNTWFHDNNISDLISTATSLFAQNLIHAINPFPVSANIYPC